MSRYYMHVDDSPVLEYKWSSICAFPNIETGKVGKTKLSPGKAICNFGANFANIAAAGASSRLETLSSCGEICAFWGRERGLIMR